MLIPIAPRLGEAEIQELLGWSVFPDPESLQRAVDLYANGKAHTLLGLESEGRIIGLIGYCRPNADTIEIAHIAVTPEERYKGYGRGLILELLAMENPAVLVAETDEEAVDFYRSSRFTVESLGEKYGVERFKCTYDPAAFEDEAEDEDEDENA
ncbi:GNAT family N-acetyltransferase [Paenibacillus lycopersici]|uniref:GNAT family N-acetyltransferase n=1 Tax=Paenibacillus lycopersici TaxID=2704462 RepID=A0A6C0G3V0_9BACL|nr:GNAT family N-acetyltransferase [Paenibacillus lycopersici]QHT63212.1 GNAT family N-acetyltransferase [Paenibacillus lycopersici]